MDDAWIAFVLLGMVIAIALIIFCVAYVDSVRKICFRRKMKKHASKVKDDGEFESAFNYAMSNIDVKEMNKEHRKNFRKAFFILSLFIFVLSLLFICTIIVSDLSIFGMLIGLLILIFFIPYSATKWNDLKFSKYIQEVIKNLIIKINDKVEFYSVQYDKYIKILNGKFEYSKFNIFTFAEINFYTYDYMYYRLDYNTCIKLAELISYSIPKMMSHAIHASRISLEGIMLKIERNKIINEEIEIKPKKIIKKDTVIEYVEKDEFDKYFNLYSTGLNKVDEDYVDKIVTKEVRDELVKLYKEYGIMFEILLKGQEINIKIFTGELFKTKTFSLSPINKKKFKRDYILLKSIMQIAEKVNMIF